MNLTFRKYSGDFPAFLGAGNFAPAIKKSIEDDHDL